MRYRSSILAAVMLFAMLIPGQGQNKVATAQDGKSAPAEVKIDNFNFTPATITVPVGTTVRWTNRDDIPHTVVSDDGKFQSKTLDTDDQYTYTFVKPGNYGYYCSIHPKMRGKVVVQ